MNEVMSICLNVCSGGLIEPFPPVFSTNFPARAAYQVAALPRVSASHGPLLFSADSVMIL